MQSIFSQCHNHVIAHGKYISKKACLTFPHTASMQYHVQYDRELTADFHIYLANYGILIAFGVGNNCIKTELCTSFDAFKEQFCFFLQCLETPSCSTSELQ